LGCSNRAQRMRYHRLSAKFMQDFGSLRAHPGAKPGGENNCSKRRFYHLSSIIT